MPRSAPLVSWTRFSSLIINTASFVPVGNSCKCQQRGRTWTAKPSLVPGPQVTINRSPAPGLAGCGLKMDFWFEIFNKYCFPAQFFLEPGVSGDLDGTGWAVWSISSLIQLFFFNGLKWNSSLLTVLGKCCNTAVMGSFGNLLWLRGWMDSTTRPKPVMRDTRCETLIRALRYLYAIPWDPMHRNPPSKQRHELTPLPRLEPAEDLPWPQGHTKRKEKSVGACWRAVWICSVEVSASSQWRRGGGCGSLESCVRG